MKYVPKSVAEEFTSASTTAREYELGTTNFATVQISGRYPERGRVMNEVSVMSCYVLEGTCELVVEGTSYSLAKGDVCLIEPGERYYWQGELVVAISSTPAWTKEQQREIE